MTRVAVCVRPTSRRTAPVDPMRGAGSGTGGVIGSDTSNDKATNDWILICKALVLGVVEGLTDSCRCPAPVT